MKIVLSAVLVAIVIIQPFVGWRTIPEFFNYSVASAILLGALDGLLLIGAGVLAITHFAAR